MPNKHGYLYTTEVQMKDQLSALVDGELELADSSHLITAIKAGGEMNESWSMYHLIGDVMRGDTHTNPHLTANIMQALYAEPTIIAPLLISDNISKSGSKSTNKILNLGNKPRFNLNKYWSIAASIAAVMFVGVMVLQMQLTGFEELTPVEIANSGTNGTLEYLQAHQEAAPSGSAYYIQNASFNDVQQ